MILNKSPKFSVTQNSTILNIFHVNAGEGLSKHEHEFAHLTMCLSGSIVVRKDGRELIMTKDTQPVNLKEKEWHEIEALEDDTVFINVFASN
jgi:tellurite resistance-related uncharacterized protein